MDFTKLVQTTAAQLAKTLASEVVNCSHTYTDGGQERTQTFDAIEGNVSQSSIFKLEGKFDRELKTLTVGLDKLDFYEMRPGEQIATRKGEDAARTRTVLDIAISHGLAVITVERQYE